MKENSYHLKEMQVLGLKAQYFLNVLKFFWNTESCGNVYRN